MMFMMMVTMMIFMMMLKIMMIGVVMMITDGVYIDTDAEIRMLIEAVFCKVMN